MCDSLDQQYNACLQDRSTETQVYVNSCIAYNSLVQLTKIFKKLDAHSLYCIDIIVPNALHLQLLGENLLKLSAQGRSKQ